MRKIRVALAQINPVVGDLEGNAEKTLGFIRRAQEVKADLISFPELSLCGYPPEDLLLKEGFVKDSLNALHYIAGEVTDIVAIVGCVDRDDKGDIYNSAAVIREKKIKAIYHKIELPNYSVFDEKRYFQKGSRIYVFRLGGVVWGVNICEDIWLNRVAERQKEKGAEIIFNISASPYHMGKINLRKKILREKAERLKTHICYNNLVGGQDELVFDGGSFILNSEGGELARGEQFEEDLVVCDLAVGRETKTANKGYIELGSLKTTPLPLLKRKEASELNPWEEVYKALILGTRDYVTKNGFQKVVIGLSGGIDSSLTAVIACDAIGRENVLGVSMPSTFSSQETQKDAESLAENLGIKFIKIPIKRIFHSYLEGLKKEFQGEKADVTEENIQARIRGNILMALSNKFGWLVLATGNKSEVSCGYCTLYGDMAGGFSVLKDVYKTLVYKLAEFRNRKEGRDLIPESVFKRPPTAELRPNQTDQDVLPPYPILDEILKEYIEEDKNYKEIIEEKRFDPKMAKKVINMVDKNEYKRRQAPPGIKITPKAFGKDRRMPITNKYKG